MKNHFSQPFLSAVNGQRLMDTGSAGFERMASRNPLIR